MNFFSNRHLLLEILSEVKKMATNQTQLDSDLSALSAAFSTLQANFAILIGKLPVPVDLTSEDTTITGLTASVNTLNAQVVAEIPK
jgi:hypothetical protein